MKTKKITAFLLAAATTLTLTSCGVSTKTDSKVVPVSKDDLSISRTISVAVLDNVTAEQWGTAYHKFFQDKFNIKWDYNYVDWDSWNDKMRLWTSSGDLPDVSIWDYNYADAKSYADQGLLYKLPDDWKTNYPNLAKAYNASTITPELEKRLGGTYVLPRPINVFNAQTDPIVNQIGVIGIRKDWANAVGFPIKDSYTVNETLEYAKLIKEKDPGKIGKLLIPLSYDPSNALTCLVSANAPHSRAETAFYKDASGKYKWGPGETATLDALKIYKQAYDSGLLDKEFYLMNDNDKDKFYINGTAALYHMGGVATFRQTCDEQMATNLKLNSDDVVQEAIVTGNDNKYHNIILGGNYWSSLIFSPKISKENFARVMTFLDYTCTPEGQIVSNMGIENTDWKYDSNKTPVSMLTAPVTLASKYGPLIESMYILEDDFTVNSPSIKKSYRDRMKTLAQLKLKEGKDQYSPVDWTQEFYTSKTKDQAQLDYSKEYANLIVKSGDLTTNWNEWVKSKSSLINPYLDELNAIK